MPLFSKEQWDKIYATRARLEAYRLKIQPYPAYPDEPPEKPPQLEQVIIHYHSNMSKQDWDLLQQTARKLEYLEKKLAEKRKGGDYEPF